MGRGLLGCAVQNERLEESAANSNGRTPNAESRLKTSRKPVNVGLGRFDWKLSSDSFGFSATSLPPIIRWRLTGSLPSAGADWLPTEKSPDSSSSSPRSVLRMRATSALSFTACFSRANTPSRLERQFELLWRAVNGPALEPEFRFHPTRKWRADYAHLESRPRWLARGAAGGSPAYSETVGRVATMVRSGWIGRSGEQIAVAAQPN